MNLINYIYKLKSLNVQLKKLKEQQKKVLTYMVLFQKALVGITNSVNLKKVNQRKCSVFFLSLIAKPSLFHQKEKKIRVCTNVQYIRQKIEVILTYSLLNLKQDSLLESGFQLVSLSSWMLKVSLMKLRKIKSEKNHKKFKIINISIKIINNQNKC